MTSLSLRKLKHNDNYGTPDYAWKMILPFIPKDKILYDGFYLNGNSKTFFERQGYQMIHQDLDFFKTYQNVNYDIFVSNIPFTLKQPTLKILNEIDKPFIIICPVSIITKMFLKNIFKEKINDIQYIIPGKRIHYLKNGDETKRCWWDTIFVTYKLNLNSTIVYL